MYVRDVMESLLRRWYLVVLALALTVGVCLLAGRSIPPTYKTEASVVLIPPKSVEDPSANRFLGLSGLSQAVDVLTRAVNADTARQAIKKVAPEGTFEAATDGTTSAPVLVITVKAGTAAEAETLVAAVLEQVPLSLSSLQEVLSVKPDAEITAIPLARDAEPAKSQKARLRAIAALSLLCLAGSVFLIGALDGLLLVRSKRKELEREAAAEGAPAGPPPGTDTADGAWLENELATISSGALGSQSVTRDDKRTARKGSTPRDR